MENSFSVILHITRVWCLNLPTVFEITRRNAKWCNNCNDLPNLILKDSIYLEASVMELLCKNCRS